MVARSNSVATANKQYQSSYGLGLMPRSIEFRPARYQACLVDSPVPEESPPNINTVLIPKGYKPSAC